MTDVLSEPQPTLRPAEKYAQLETDTFCVGCGYNLHGQPVVRDERLGLYVCRCPECGRFHPAGTGVTATNAWLNRLAIGLLVLWVLIVTGAVISIAIFLGACQMIAVDALTYTRMVAASGEDVEWKMVKGTGYTMVKKGTTQPVAQWQMVYSFEPPPDADPWRFKRPWWAPYALTLLSAGVGLGAGILLSVFVWHWPRKRYSWATVIPMIVAAVVSLIAYANESYDWIRAWAVTVFFGLAVVQAAALFGGTLIGRPIARMLLRMFVPPRPRQHFAFLWGIDGKKTPGAVTTIAAT
jgi:hypothetical protein